MDYVGGKVLRQKNDVNPVDVSARIGELRGYVHHPKRSCVCDGIQSIFGLKHLHPRDEQTVFAHVGLRQMERADDTHSTCYSIITILAGKQQR